MTGDSSATVYLILSSVGKIFDTVLDEGVADHRAKTVGGLVVPLTPTRDYRSAPGQPAERPAPSVAPFRAVPDVQ
jgi:hypothetical protein